MALDWQSILASPLALSLSVASVEAMSDDEARATLRALRWEDGEPACPRCDCRAVYEYNARRIFKCQGCDHQFSVTSGTIFASRKLPARDILLAIAIFVTSPKTFSASHLSRVLGSQYKTAFRLSRQLMASMK